jgi:hypothetical protein
MLSLPSFCARQIQPSMTFEYALDSQGRIRQVLVYQNNQRVQALNSCTGQDIPHGNGLGELAREDFNFDGYLDLMIQVAFDPRSENSSYCIWLYDSKTQTFAVSEELSHLTNPTPDPDSKTIVARRNILCAGRCYEQDTYKWTSGHLERVREESVTEDPLVSPESACRYVWAVKKEKNGKLVEIKRERVDPGGVRCESHSPW